MKATKQMTFTELIEKFPKAADVLMSKNLGCVGCMLAGTETVEQGCKNHGLTDKEIDKIIKEINE